MLSSNEEKELLRGLDKVYAQRPQDLLEEVEQCTTITVGGYTVRKINGSFEEYARVNGLINVNDIQWSI